MSSEDILKTDFIMEERMGNVGKKTLQLGFPWFNVRSIRFVVWLLEISVSFLHVVFCFLIVVQIQLYQMDSRYRQKQQKQFQNLIQRAQRSLLRAILHKKKHDIHQGISKRQRLVTVLKTCWWNYSNQWEKHIYYSTSSNIQTKISLETRRQKLG